MAADERDPWMSAMRRGDFRLAWQISDAHLAARRARGEPKHQGPRHLQHIWDGAPLAGKRVLVRCYHGLGDTVQYIRFAAYLKRIARDITVWAQPCLVDLIATAPGVDRVLPLHDGAPETSYDCDIEIMELAHALRVDADAIRCAVPYLFPPSRAREHPHATFKIGLVWRAGGWDPRRSIDADLLKPLSSLSDVRLFSLQCGPAAAEACRIPARDVSNEDPMITADVLRSLDLLISVDTFAAHLAGALGVPVWLLLHAQCDWRWMAQGDESVWYPTMRLFRQPFESEWHAVMHHVVASLEKIIASRSMCERSAEQTSGPDVRPS
jgi:hypothetical protein